MRTRPAIVLLALATAGVLLGRSSRAQPNLPPPPPPPMDQPGDVPRLPPPPPGPEGQSPAPRRPEELNPAPRRPASSPPSPARAAVRPRRPESVVVDSDERPPARPLAITLNPVDLIVGRLSANVEVQLEPHHALVVSPNVLVFPVGRGGPKDVVSEGLGFASRTSQSYGIELGYHYWLQGWRALRGPFVGPSLLLGLTTDGSVGDSARLQSYWGVALDVGWQEVLPSGFTAGAGAGLELVRMGGSGGVVPRLLAQVGWSF
jgi:hypothetical protein